MATKTRSRRRAATVASGVLLIGAFGAGPALAAPTWENDVDDVCVVVNFTFFDDNHDGRNDDNNNGTDGTSTDMTSTDLTSTDLTSTDLTSTDMTSTDMTSTDMTSTDMTSTDMTSTTNLTTPDITDGPSISSSDSSRSSTGSSGGSSTGGSSTGGSSTGGSSTGGSGVGGLLNLRGHSAPAHDPIFVDARCFENRNDGHRWFEHRSVGKVEATQVKSVPKGAVDTGN